MLEKNKKDFLFSLQRKIEEMLKKSGVKNVIVETYDERGKPMIEVSGPDSELIEAKYILRMFEPMLVWKPDSKND